MDAKTYWKKWADKCRADLTTDIMPFWLKYGWANPGIRSKSVTSPANQCRRLGFDP